MANFDEVLDVILLNVIDESDDENDRDAGDHRIEINIENWKRLGDPTFFTHFRMDRMTFELLLIALGNHLENNNRMLRRSKIEKGLDFYLLMVLWILATLDTFRSVGMKFGVEKGSVHFHYKYIIEALREMAPVYIKWPSDYEKELISTTFENRYGFPSVVGCMDGCLIQIIAPRNQPEQYVDWHRNHSINVQAVCDDRLLFRDVYVGQPGSVGDKRTFMRSPLGQNILSPDVLSENHLLADGGYTLSSHVIIPYPNNGHLTRRQRTYNYYLSRCRSSIERAFALLKNKWRRLKFFPGYCIEYAIDHIVACMVLHNFIILEGEECQGIQLPNANADPNYLQLMRQARLDGIQKREYLAEMLHP